MDEEPTYNDLKQTIVRLENHVSEQHQLAVTLEESHARFKTIIESAIHAIVVVNDRGFIVEWSSQAELLCGWSRDDIVGKPIYSLMPKKYRKNHKSILPMVLSGARGLDFGKRIETSILNRNEFEVPIELAVSLTRVGDRQEFNLFMHDITERKNHEAQLRQMSITDDLTGLFNRRGFMAMADHQLQVACRKKDKIFLLYADFDNMKWINDTHGHQMGDNALIETAEILKKTFRQADLIGRVGGDEFIVLITNHENKNPLENVLTRFEKNIAQANGQQNRKFKILLSSGTVHYDHDEACSIDDLMIKADNLMYENKRQKKASGQYSHI
ncbi:MAG: diguanylate cyclase [Desulfobulbaceae bacterium]|nr:diguanylate cyclase [Desulfobulbaceae bacterium]